MTLDQMHYDVVEHIFDYLDLVDIISVQQLSPLLRSYGEEFLFRSEYRRFELGKRVIHRLLKVRCHMNELDIIQTVMKHFGSYIVELIVDISSLTPSNVPAIMQLISQHCDGLTHFSFISLSATFDWSLHVPNLSKLTSFKVITSFEIDSFDDDVVSSYLKHCSSSLKMLNLKGLTIDGSFLDKLPNLQSLSIKELHHNQPYEYEALFRNVADYLKRNCTLIELRLPDCGSNSLVPLYQHMQQVQLLTIRGGCLQNLEDINDLVKLPNLRRLTLDLYHSSSIVNETTFIECIHGLAICDRLKSLTVKLPYKSKFVFTGPVINAFHFTQLETFKLVANRIDTQSFDPIFQILSGNRFLTRLTLRLNRCNVSAICNKFPNLSYLKVQCHNLVGIERIGTMRIKQLHLVLESRTVPTLHDILQSMDTSYMTETLTDLKLSMSNKAMSVTLPCYQLLQNFKQLRTLSILGPSLPDACFFYLAMLKKLKEITCSHAEQPIGVTNGIRELLKEAICLRSLTLTTNEGTAGLRKEFEALTNCVELCDLNYRGPIVQL